MLVEVDVEIDDILNALSEQDRIELSEELKYEFEFRGDREEIRQLVYLAQMECLNMKLPHYLKKLLYQITGAEFGV